MTQRTWPGAALAMAAALVTATALPASVKPCRDASGKIIRCADPKPKPARCKDAAGRFVRCPDAGAAGKDAASNGQSPAAPR